MNHLLLSKCVWCISFLGDSELQWSRNHHMGWEKYQSLASFMWRYFTYHHILSLAACCNFVGNGRGTPLHKLHIGGTHQWSAGQTNTVMRLPMLHCHMSLEDGDSAKWWGHGNNPNNSFSVYVLIKTTAIVALVHRLLLRDGKKTPRCSKQQKHETGGWQEYHCSQQRPKEFGDTLEFGLATATWKTCPERCDEHRGIFFWVGGDKKEDILSTQKGNIHCEIGPNNLKGQVQL